MGTHATTYIVGPGGVNSPLLSLNNDRLCPWLEEWARRHWQKNPNPKALALRRFFDPRQAFAILGVQERPASYDIRVNAPVPGATAVAMTTEAVRGAIAAAASIVPEFDQIGTGYQGLLDYSTATPDQLFPNDTDGVLRDLGRGTKWHVTPKIVGCAGCVAGLIDVHQRLCGVPPFGRRRAFGIVAGSNNSYARCPPGDRPDELARFAANNVVEAIVFGNAAAAVPLASAVLPDDQGVLATFVMHDTRSTAITAYAGGTQFRPEADVGFTMHGGDIARDAPLLVEAALDGVLEEARANGHNLQRGDIQIVVPHQAAKRVFEHLRALFPDTTDVLQHAGHMGNIAAPGVLHLWNSAWRQNKLKEGTLVLIIAPGSGWQVAAVLLRVPAGLGSDS